MATQSAGCDGTIPPYLLQGDGVSSSGKCLINAMQDYVCLTNSDGKKCVSSEVMGKTLRSSGVLELLRNPDGAMKKILDGLTNGVAPSNSDLGAVLSEAVASGTLPSLCTALNEGSCCAGSFVELLRKTTPSLCVGQLGSIFNTFGTLCAGVRPCHPASNERISLSPELTSLTRITRMGWGLRSGWQLHPSTVIPLPPSPPSCDHTKSPSSLTHSHISLLPSPQVRRRRLLWPWLGAFQLPGHRHRARASSLTHPCVLQQIC